jgi:hypothetical protein
MICFLKSWIKYYLFLKKVESESYFVAKQIMLKYYLYN